MILSCRWPTDRRLPYFANLKVMRGALGAVRGAVESADGALGAYLFFDDEFRFLAQSKDGGGRLPGVLQGVSERGRQMAADEFRASDHKELWGPPEEKILPDTAREAAAGELLQALVDAGLAPSASDYPWCGGPWLLDRL